MSKQHENVKKKILNNIEEDNAKVIEVNNELKINVDERHIDMQHLK